MNRLLISIKNWFLLFVLLGALLVFCYFHLYRYLSFQTLQHYQAATQAWTHTHYKAAVSLYLVIYIGLIACAIPCATLLTLIGGFLFGDIAIVYAMVGTTLGGCVLFYAIQTAIGVKIAERSSGWIKKMEIGFQRNAFNYLLMLRLIPIFPCWVSNVTAGILNVPLKTFIGATILGIIPATFIYVTVGQGLDKFISSGQTLNLNILFTPTVIFPFLGLALVSIFPVFYNGIKKLNQNRG